MSEWQDIATAPRDGTRVLVCNADDELWWPEVAKWDYDDVWWGGDTYIDESNLTHWQPLPAPPVIK